MLTQAELPPLDMNGCQHVFVDCGANVGANIVALFSETQPRRKSNLHRAFDKYFGATLDERRQAVCAIAIEPNVHHAEVLKALEQRHRMAGFRTFFLPYVASSDTSGRKVPFFFDNSRRGRAHKEWGASIYSIGANRGSANVTRAGDLPPNATRLPVPTLDIARLLRDIVLARKLPTERGNAGGHLKAPERPPAVVVKMDVEGSEFSLLSRLLFLGVMCQLDYLGVEYHDEKRFLELLNAAGAPKNFARVLAWMRTNAGPECNRLELVNLGLRDNA